MSRTARTLSRERDLRAARNGTVRFFRRPIAQSLPGHTIVQASERRLRALGQAKIDCTGKSGLAVAYQPFLQFEHQIGFPRGTDQFSIGA